MPHRGLVQEAHGLPILCSSRFTTAVKNVIAFGTVEVRDDCTFAASRLGLSICIRESKLDNKASLWLGSRGTRLALPRFIQVYNSSENSYRVWIAGGARPPHICRLEPGIDNSHSQQQIRYQCLIEVRFKKHTARPSSVHPGLQQQRKQLSRSERWRCATTAHLPPRARNRQFAIATAN